MEKSQILRDCIMLKPGTSVEEFHSVLCHYPVSLLSGDYVRAEVNWNFDLSISTFNRNIMKYKMKKDKPL